MDRQVKHEARVGALAVLAVAFGGCTYDVNDLRALPGGTGGVQDGGWDLLAGTGGVIGTAVDGPLGNPEAANDLNEDEAGVDVSMSDGVSVCRDPQSRVCADPANPLVGACRAGTQTCSNGAWGGCKDEVLPAPESCNGVDDDCDGATDEDCVDTCVVVAPGGVDGVADGTAAKPFGSVQAALSYAASGGVGAGKRVCVAGGASCADGVRTYQLSAPLSIPSGARLAGNYALSGSTLRYCGDTQAPTTALSPTSVDATVSFGPGAATSTELSGFSIVRYASGDTGTVSAVAIAGATNVILSRLFITDEPSADRTYGIVIEAGGQATIVRSAITAGQGKSMAAAVYVNGGAVNLRGNCDRMVGGACKSSCEVSVLGLRGRTPALADATAVDTSAVFISASSASPSSIAGNLLCGGQGIADPNVGGANVATLRCDGAGCASVTGNVIVGGSAAEPVAVAVSNGSGRLDGNLIQAGCGSDVIRGVRLNGSGARLTNNRILGNGCGTGSSAALSVGVHVLYTAGGAEPEIVSNVIDPMGNGGDCESHGVNVVRTSGSSSPLGILRNNIVATGNCRKGIAIDVSESAQVRAVQNNDLYPGPASPPGANTILFRQGGNAATSVAESNSFAGASDNISADPKFLAYPDDLHLTAESPCIDKGIATGAPETDSEGTARPQGAGYDIGAYEYVASGR